MSMGGSGSGRFGRRYPRAEQFRRIDLAQLWREHTLSVRSVVQISHQRRDGTEVKSRICFTETTMRFGGRRLWFICPRCGHRCRVLYGGHSIMCRHCHGLRYQSQSETRRDRATSGMFKVVQRLDPEQQFNEMPPKPKGMHWRTYERLANRYAHYDAVWAAEVMRRFGGRL